MTTGTFLDGVIQAPVSRQIPVKKTKLQPIFVSRLALKDHLTQIEAGMRYYMQCVLSR